MKWKEHKELWKAYKHTHDIQLRNALVERYMPLARDIAVRYSRRIHKQMPIDDLFSEACVGLMDAIEKFDLSRHLKFGTYASQRIHGHITDSIRRYDPLSRMVRTHQKRYAKVEKKIEMEQGRKAVPEEVFEKMEFTQLALGEKVKSCGAGRRGSKEEQFKTIFQNAQLHAPVAAGLVMHTEKMNGAGARSDKGHPVAPQNHLPAELEEVMEYLTRGFQKRFVLILRLYYLNQWTLNRIGKLLRVSESRVSQILGQCLPLMRERGERIIRLHGHERLASIIKTKHEEWNVDALGRKRKRTRYMEKVMR